MSMRLRPLVGREAEVAALDRGLDEAAAGRPAALGILGEPGIGKSRLLGVHVNTLLYRLGRIEEILGRKLDDPEVRMAMAVALRARRLVTGMESVIEGAKGAPDRAPTLRKVPGALS